MEPLTQPPSSFLVAPIKLRLDVPESSALDRKKFLDASGIVCNVNGATFYTVLEYSCNIFIKISKTFATTGRIVDEITTNVYSLDDVGLVDRVEIMEYSSVTFIILLQFLCKCLGPICDR